MCFIFSFDLHSSLCFILPSVSHSLWGVLCQAKYQFVCFSLVLHLNPFIMFCCPVAKSCLTLSDAMDCSMLGFLVLHYLPGFVQTQVHWVSDAIQPFHPLPPSSPFAFRLSQNQSFSNELCPHIRWTKYWSISIRPTNEDSRLFSFRIDWFDLLAI